MNLDLYNPFIEDEGMKQPKVYIKSLGVILPVKVINFHKGTVEVYSNDNADFVPYDFNEGKFMYNTGYKDVNGAYIYTGDILEYVRGEAIFNGKKFLLKISAEQEFYYLASKKFCGIQLSDMDTTEELSVIGNIYENKYLWED